MGTTEDAVVWFKTSFGTQIRAAVKNTPITENLIAAIAMQETSYLWRSQYKSRPLDEVLALCVGDTIDGPTRRAFPQSRAELEAAPKGKEMFRIARAALEQIAKVNASYARVARNRSKFCHGFGMFQYDLQFFQQDPTYFLDQRWATFDGTLGKCIDELKEKIRSTYGKAKKTLSHDESVYVAIAYNKGSVDVKKSFKQGFKDSSGKYYGERIDVYMRTAERLG